MRNTEILRRAKQIATAQGRLADSPAVVDKNGAVILCAASCIAKAAVELHGCRDAASEFDRRVITEDKSSFVPSVFRKYGLTGASAKQAMIENDTRPEAERLSWFQSLRHP